MGTFTLQGLIELFSLQKLKEKEMANQTMKRLKLAKFNLVKSYVSKSLKQLVQGKYGANAPILKQAL